MTFEMRSIASIFFFKLLNFSCFIAVPFVNLYFFFKRWVFFINHKDIGTLYFIFGGFSSVVGTWLSLLIRMQLAFPGGEALSGNWQLYNACLSLKNKKKIDELVN
jgi:hypothetical protein